MDISHVDLLNQNIQNPHCLEFKKRQQSTHKKEKKIPRTVTAEMKRGLSKLYNGTQCVVCVLFYSLC